MRILVTGAGGFVGRHLIPNLVSGGHEVIAASRGPMATPQALGIEVFDMRDGPAIRKIIEKYGPEGVIHLAAQASVPRSWEKPEETYETNIIGSGRLLEALKDRVQTRVLLIGSAQVYGSGGQSRPLLESDPLRPASPYAVSKLAQELIGSMFHQQFALPLMMSRPFNHTGPGQSTEFAVGSFCRQVVEIERGIRAARLETDRLDTKRDFLDVRDVVEAYRRLTESGRPGEIYNVASGNGVLIRELLGLLLELAGLSSKVEVVEDASSRRGEPESLVGDVSKIRSTLGWEPRVSLEQSLVDTLNWHRSQPSVREKYPRVGGSP